MLICCRRPYDVTLPSPPRHHRHTSYVYITRCLSVEFLLSIRRVTIAVCRHLLMSVYAFTILPRQQLLTRHHTHVTLSSHHFSQYPPRQLYVFAFCFLIFFTMTPFFCFRHIFIFLLLPPPDAAYFSPCLMNYGVEALSPAYALRVDAHAAPCRYAAADATAALLLIWRAQSAELCQR